MIQHGRGAKVEEHVQLSYVCVLPYLPAQPGDPKIGGQQGRPPFRLLRLWRHGDYAGAGYIPLLHVMYWVPGAR